MNLEWEQVVIEALDPQSLGRWWSEALHWMAVNDDPNEFEIQPQADQHPGIIFLQARGPRRFKNRLHLDFRPKDQKAEVERHIALGASRLDVGQGDVSWVVLADPEGNEFCVLQERQNGATDNVRSSSRRPNAAPTKNDRRAAPDIDGIPVQRWWPERHRSGHSFVSAG